MRTTHYMVLDRVLVLWTISIFTTVFLYAKNDAFFGGLKNTFKKVYAFSTRHNVHITVLENTDKRKLVVKQDPNPVVTKWLAVAREKLGALIAQSVGILVNEVEIIPIGEAFIGKHIKEIPATIHTFVPGASVNDLPSSLRNFKVFIRQPVRTSVPEKERGLSRTVITDMATHRDLPAIVALDTFIANGGRHGNNFFYDKETDNYWVIDLESSFRADSALYAGRFIQSMIDRDEKVTLKELYALKKYHAVLKELVMRYSPDSMYETLIELAQEARIPLHVIESELLTCKKYIVQNYESCKKLITLLDTFLLSASNKYRNGEYSFFEHGY